MVHIENARLMQDIKGGRRALDVKLIPRPACERALPVRAELRLDAELTQELERAARHRRIRDVEMERKDASTTEMKPSRRMEDP